MNPHKLIPIAQAMAQLSKDPSTQVGAIIIDSDGNILSAGYNGFPRGVIDSQARYHHRPTKYSLIAHAEANAIAQAARVGARLLDSTLIVTALHPCSDCAKLIIQAGIRAVYVPDNNSGTIDDHWIKEAGISQRLFREAGVKIVVYPSQETAGRPSTKHPALRRQPQPLSNP